MEGVLRVVGVMEGLRMEAAGVWGDLGDSEGRRVIQ